jgi:hypothetical protein
LKTIKIIRINEIAEKNQSTGFKMLFFHMIRKIKEQNTINVIGIRNLALPSIIPKIG